MRFKRLMIVFLVTSLQAAAEVNKEDIAHSEQCRRGDKIACDLLKSRCDRDLSYACFNLAITLGLMEKDVEGLKFLKKSCKLGYRPACKAIPDIEDYIRSKGLKI